MTLKSNMGNHMWVDSKAKIMTLKSNMGNHIWVDSKAKIMDKDS